MGRMSTATTTDRARQVVVTLAEVFCIVGTLVGTGVIGTRVAESSGGALAADATLLAPLGPAFSIWSVVYAGLAAYTIWQWLPSVAASPRARATGWLAAASMALNAAWLLVTQQGWLWTSVAVIVALVLVLGVLVQRLTDLGDPATLADRVVVDGTFGLYLGWVAVAVCANVTATLVEQGVTPSSPVADAIAVAVLVVVVGRRRRGARPHRSPVDLRRRGRVGTLLDRGRPADRQPGVGRRRGGRGRRSPRRPGARRAGAPGARRQRLTAIRRAPTRRRRRGWCR